MATQQHTPGPWSVPHFARDDHSCNCGYILSGNQYGMGAIATVHRQSEPDGQDNEPDDIAAANARLIAAAPDLLETLQAIMDERWSPSGRSEHVSDLARAAIAKALGEPTPL